LPPPSAWHADRLRTTKASGPLEMANRGTHEKVLQLVREFIDAPERTRVLDIGAGMGALSARLLAAGYAVEACDLYPEVFCAAGVHCRSVEAGGRLPYDDQSLDVALAVEIVEHIENHATLFAEVRRVLRPGGLFLFTTPNILALRSRMLFLFTGYLYSFPSLDPEVLDPVAQHITPFSLDRYRWRLRQSGLEFMRLSVDKYQRSSRILALILAPMIWLMNRKKARESESVQLQNSVQALLGRTLFVLARRPGR
jgi:SAM-dependent methyltransferase